MEKSINFEQIEKDKIIESYVRFQDLLISISTKYINADVSNINKLVETSLKQIGEFVGADRSYVFSYDFENKTTTNTFEWCGEGIVAEIDNLQNIPIDLVQIWLESHKKGEAFNINDVSLLDNDGGLRNLLESQGIKSLITIPKIKNNELIGFIGFDSVRKKHEYSEDEKNILFVFSNMLVNVIQRKEHERLIKNQEEKKEELLKDLSIQNEKLNEYAHMVSHDLKAPLINIHTIIDWFIADNQELLGEELLEPLKEVLLNVERMDFLIKGILDYSTINRLDSNDSLLDLNVLISEVLTSLLIPENITIKVQENLPNVLANNWRFKQVFQNLIQNAIKYNDKENGFIEVGAVDKNECYEFFIRDNGIGINSNYFDKIFKVFTKLESTSSSSGIGLSIVKKVINFYNGTIWLESKEQEGTTFYFTILK